MRRTRIRTTRSKACTHRFILFGVSVLIALLYSGRAFGCGCEKPGPPCKAFGEASVVFIGTVTGLTEGARKRKPDGEVDFTPRLFKFSVEESFSGTPPKEAEVATSFEGRQLRLPLRQGRGLSRLCLS